jgi:hypothetical protein
MPTVDPNPPPYEPTRRYMQEQCDKLHDIHKDFLQPAECDMMHDFMCKQEKGFTWTNSKRGQFCKDFFPSINIPVIPHIPFIEQNIPIPPGIYL